MRCPGKSARGAIPGITPKHHLAVAAECWRRPGNVGRFAGPLGLSPEMRRNSRVVREFHWLFSPRTVGTDQFAGEITMAFTMLKTLL
jgi:hypothetical protein